MKRYLFLLIFLLSISQVQAQTYNQPAGVFGQTINRLRVNYVFIPPVLLDTLLHVAEDSVGSVKFAVQDNSLRRWNGSIWLKISGGGSGGGGGSTTYAGLTDVALTSIANGQLVKWNSGTSKWNNFTPDYGGIVTLDITHWNEAYNKYNVSGAYSAGTVTFTRKDGTTWTVTGFPTTFTPSGSAGGDLAGTYPNPTLGTAGTAGTYGSATQVPVFTTDTKGRVTSVTNTAITFPSSLPPSGSAGGDLTGTYPNPTLAAAGTAGTYGSATQVPVFTTDSKGRVTGVTNTTITGAPPTGSAGGDLTGTYPNPTLAAAGTAGTYGSGTQVPVFTTDSKGRVTGVTNTTITGAPPNGSAGGDLTGTYPNPTLAAAGTAGTYGSATQVPVFTTDSKGRVTGVTNTTITGTLSPIPANTVPANTTAGSAVPLNNIPYTAAATGSTLPFRDAQGNVSLNDLALNTTTVTTTGGTTTLGVSATYSYKMTGTSNHTVQLPVTSVLRLYQFLFIRNISTGYVTVNSSGGNLVILMEPQSVAILRVNAQATTTAADWDVDYTSPTRIRVTGTGNQSAIIPLGTGVLFIAQKSVGSETVQAGTGGFGTNNIFPNRPLTGGTIDNVTVLKEIDMSAASTIYFSGAVGSVTYDIFKLTPQ